MKSDGEVKVDTGNISFSVIRREPMIRVHSKKSMIRTAIVAASAVIALLPFVSATAEDNERKLIRVEEDWMVLIEETDRNATSPQINNVISFSSSQTSLYGMVELNHGTSPSFRSGGIQVQARNDEDVIAQSSWREGYTLNEDFDRLEYTVTLFHHCERTYVGIKNVRSKTFGDSGGNEIRAQIASWEKPLTDYRPDHSASASSVNVGAQRVATMCMPRVRYYYSNGDIETDETVRYAERYRTSQTTVNLEEFSSTVSLSN